MKIVNTPLKAKIIDFAHLCPEDVFKYNERYYIKFNDSDDDANCIALDDQITQMVDRKIEVILIDENLITLTIEE